MNAGRPSPNQLSTSPFTASMSRRQRIETTFCRDFTCCGYHFDDLHDLLQHYEEVHPGDNLALLDNMAVDGSEGDGATDLDETASIDDLDDPLAALGIEKELQEVLAAAAGFAGFDTDGNPIFAIPSPTSTDAQPSQPAQPSATTTSSQQQQQSTTLADFRQSFAGIVRGVTTEDDLPFELEDMDAAVEIPPMVAAALAQVTGNNARSGIMDNVAVVSMAEVAAGGPRLNGNNLHGLDSDATDTEDEQTSMGSSAEAMLLEDDEELFNGTATNGQLLGSKRGSKDQGNRLRLRDRKRTRTVAVAEEEDDDELMLSAALEQSILDSAASSRAGSPFGGPRASRRSGLSRRGTPTPISKTTPSREMRNRRRQGLVAALEELADGGNSTASDDEGVGQEEVSRLTALANKKQALAQAQLQAAQVRKLMIKNNQLIAHDEEEETDVSGDEGGPTTLLRLKPEHQRMPKLPPLHLASPMPQKGVFASSSSSSLGDQVPPPTFGGMLQADGTPFPPGVLPPTFASVAAKKKPNGALPSMAPPAFTPGVVPSRVKTPAQRSPARTGTPGSTYSGDGGGDDGRKYVCEQPGCEKKYKNPGGLKYHMQVGVWCFAREH